MNLCHTVFLQQLNSPRTEAPYTYPEIYEIGGVETRNLQKKDLIVLSRGDKCFK